MSTFKQTHELKSVYRLHQPIGYAAECWCGYITGCQRWAFLAVLAQSRHSCRALKELHA